MRPPDIAKPSDPYKWIGGQTADRCCGGADSRIRTHDLLITNELLYQLSHISIFDLILYDTPHITLTANDLLIYGQKYSRLARLSLSQFSLFLPFASSLALPLAAVACSANELLYQLSHISISDLNIIHQSHTFVNINSSIFLKFCKTPVKQSYHMYLLNIMYEINTFSFRIVILHNKKTLKYD